LDKSTALNLDIVTAELLSVHDHMERKYNIKEIEKKHKAEQLALFAKFSSSGRTSGSFSRKRRSKKVKSKSKLRPADMSCHICSEKEHWTSECPKKRENKAEQVKSSGSTYVTLESSRN